MVRPPHLNEEIAIRHHSPVVEDWERPTRITLLRQNLVGVLLWLLGYTRKRRVGDQVEVNLHWLCPALRRLQCLALTSLQTGCKRGTLALALS